MSVSGDGSESVDDFLARIASVKGVRDEAGELEMRRKEEEILKNRKERQARRAERARSLSPSKTGPAQIASTIISSSQHDQAIKPPVEFSPSVKPLSRSNALSGRISPTKDVDPLSSSPRQPPSPDRDLASSQTLANATTLSRSGTLSWQQRPASRDGPILRQGLSSSSTAANSPSAHSQRESLSEEPSRKDIAASLAQKDPTWFRQTQDRGLNSAAYRKNQVDDSPIHNTSSRSMQLPGMTHQRELSKSPTPEARLSRTASPAQTNNLDSERYKRGNTPDIAALRKSMIVLSPQQQSTSQDSFSNRPVSMISNSNTDSTFGLDRSSSIVSSDRPASPTKGFGGFVESAMMKRSDSVKRWSVKADVGLRRGDSVLGGRPPTSLHGRGLSRDIHIARDASPSSPLASSRPDSGQISNSSANLGSESPTNRAKQEHDLPQSNSNTGDLVSGPVDIPERTSARSQTPQDDSSLARSPSKTMDPRRWSPTKSTWLESALQSKSEPPKLQPLKEDQPKWKVDLQRSKSRASREISPVKTKEQDENQLDMSTALVQADRPTKPVIEPIARSISTKEERQRPASGSKPDHLKLSNNQLSVQSQPSSKRIDSNGSKVDIPSSPTAMKETKDEGKDTIPATEEAKNPPVLKPKPQTPPKTDFRGTLRSRAPTVSASKGSEPEFKAMFGKLKRTTTQNYVAPDELKTNILSGKAALSTTAGPQKAKPVDAFKESLLAKKDEIKTSGTKLGQQNEVQSKPPPPLPEALARRKTLSKASAPNLRTISTAPAVISRPELQSKRVEKNTENLTQFSEKENVTASTPGKEPNILSSLPDAISRPLPLEHRNPPAKIPKPSILERSQSAEVVPRQREGIEPKQLTQKTNPTHNSTISANSHVSPSIQKSVSPDPLITNGGGIPAGSKLASRLNPNLASMLSRSNSPKIPHSTSLPAEGLSQTVALTKTSSAPAENDSESLTHMTKGRAKGPKRRAPKAETSAVQKASPSTTNPASINLSKEISSIKTDVVDTSTAKLGTAVLTPETFGGKTKSTPKQMQLNTNSLEVSAITSKNVEIDENKQPEMSRSGSVRQKPAVVNKSAELRRISGPLAVEQRPSTSPKPNLIPSPKPIAPSSSKPLLKEAVTTPTKSSTAGKVISVKDVSPKIVSKNSKTPEKSGNFKVEVSRPKPSNLQGLGIGVRTPPPAPKVTTKPQILTPPIDIAPQSTARTGPQQIREKLEGYVGAIDREQTKADFDAQQFLTATKDGAEKVKRKQYTVHEITGDGKKIVMPPQQEHILYEESMYLITHNFVNSAGTNLSEVYLWYGDRIPDAAVEDVQLFCRKDAREHNTKLEVVKQGKESSHFIEALGGILITRRSKSSSFYMLCGRRYLGHIVFDEVDMDPSNLCPGFVYLVSAQFGKFYLWKGKGAGADEIGSAKLIGMDLGLTGEIDEVAQGSESADFWQSLGTGKPAQWSADWCKRADTNGYPTVMYRIDHERPGVLGSLWALKRATSPTKTQPSKAICQKLDSFCQHDLETSAIHVLDAYRSFYILINNQSMSKGSELITSMYLVQDLAMLSPSIQDRPLLPRCYVVIGEPTSDVKACFRKWSLIDGYSLGGKESLLVTLEEAMEALGL